MHRAYTWFFIKNDMIAKDFIGRLLPNRFLTFFGYSFGNIKLRINCGVYTATDLLPVD